MKTEGIKKSLKYGNRTIDYMLEFTNRKTLGIIVTPDIIVKVKAPYDSPIEKVNIIVRKKALWILKNLEHFEVLLPKLPPKAFVSGESYYYLGKHYRLKVQKSDLEYAGIIKNQLTVFTNYKNNPRVVKALVAQWYLKRAEKKFKERYEICLNLFKRYNLERSLISIRIMKTRWGSCNTKNKITLNRELIKMPLRCIDYVIIHEICHLIYRNHDSAFYNLLTSILPDWKQRKLLLEKSINKI